MPLRLGDHACAIYSSVDELAGIVGDFLIEGLQRGERCWYLPATPEDAAAVGDRLRPHEGWVRELKADALQIMSTDTAYGVRGAEFVPEDTMWVFNDAIERAARDGFSGFRAAAEMSPLLAGPDGADRLITYEALLRTLFHSAPATGLCLYHESRMPAGVLDGALATHPIVHARRHFRRNPFYDVAVKRVPNDDVGSVDRKLRQLRHRA
jgi:hypothetical protein